MSVIFLLIPLSIVLAACFLGAFVWAVRSGQYEDTYTPSMRVLLDDAGDRVRLARPVRGPAEQMEREDDSLSALSSRRAGAIGGTPMAATETVAIPLLQN